MAEHNQRFDSFGQWVNKGRSWLTRHPDYSPECFRAVCFDAKGRHVKDGAGFMLADREGAFPVRWLWPDQIARMAAANDDTPSEATLDSVAPGA